MSWRLLIVLTLVVGFFVLAAVFGLFAPVDPAVIALAEQVVAEQAVLPWYEFVWIQDGVSTIFSLDPRTWF